MVVKYEAYTQAIRSNVPKYAEDLETANLFLAFFLCPCAWLTAIAFNFVKWGAVKKIANAFDTHLKTEPTM